jgi:L-iditol 2-dehydrogenase
MRAVRVVSEGRADVVNIDAPRAAPPDVIVNVEWASVCATDRKLLGQKIRNTPTIGHEGAGRLADGTLVGIHPDVGCGRCTECRSGYENRCSNRTSIGIHRGGCLAEDVAVPAGHAVVIDGVDAEVAPLLEPLACVLHAVATLRAAEERALVVGAGSMGILAMWALQAHGCRVVVSQRSSDRRALAQELGADAAVAPHGDPSEALGGAPRVALVAAAGAEPLAWACANVAVGGRVHAFAGTPGAALVDANIVHYRHLSLLGSTGSTVADYMRARDFVVSGEIKLERLPRSLVALDDVPAVLTRVQQRLALKTMVDVKGRRL